MSIWTLELIRDRDCKTEAEVDAMNEAIIVMKERKAMMLAGKGFEDWESNKGKALAANIKAVMDAKGVSQRELARKCRVTEVSMSRYVNGGRVPKATVLCVIARVLGVSMDALMEGVV